MRQKVRMVVWFDNDNLTPEEAMGMLADLGHPLRSIMLDYNVKWIVVDSEQLEAAELPLEKAVEIYNRDPNDDSLWPKGSVPIVERYRRH